VKFPDLYSSLVSDPRLLYKKMKKGILGNRNVTGPKILYYTTFQSALPNSTWWQTPKSIKMH
jgi:hypothetical protein